MNGEAIFNLPVHHKGEEIELRARLVLPGYQSKFIVLVEDNEIVFERDEQGEFRAILPNMNEFTGKMPEQGLLEAIHKSITAIS